MVYKEIKAHSSYVNKVVFESDGKSFYSLGFNGEIKKWDTESLKLLEEYHIHDKTVNDLIVLQNKLLSVSGDGYLKVMDKKKKITTRSYLIDKKGINNFKSVSDKLVWISTASQNLILFNISEMKILKKIKLNFKNQVVLSFNKSKNLIAVGGLGNLVHFFGSSDGQLIHAIDTHETAISSLMFLNNSKCIFLGHKGNLSLILLKKSTTENGKNLHGNNFYSMTLNKAKNILAISSAYKVTLLKVDTLEIIKEIDTICKGNYGLTFSPDGKLLALASADKKVRLWNI
nr:hypothetical protein [uncultured Psychroserpens sp.]